MRNRKPTKQKAAYKAKNLSLSPATIKMGEKLAAQDHRRFSSMMEVLIHQEWTRRGLKAA